MRKVLALMVAIAALSVIPGIRAQSPNADWEKAAGGKMSFDVASVKPNPIGTVFTITNPNIPLDSSNAYPGSTALFSANVPLFIYVGFAYKLPQYETFSSLPSQLPKWAAGEKFEIQARAASPATKDQMRLMVQSLLAERFKLAVHWDKRQVPSYDLVMIKPGKTGPQLQPHDDKTPCQPYAPNPSGYESIPGQLPSFCGILVGGNGPGGLNEAGRNVTLTQLAGKLADVFHRPVIDKTGLAGGFDINMNLRFHLTPSEVQQFDVGDIQSGYIEAVRDQLGLKLESSKTSADALVIDHIEEPSPN